jgi:hypothetical protein
VVFSNCFNELYTATSKEKKALLKLCRKFTDSDIKAAMAAAFWGMLSSGCHYERDFYPSLLGFTMDINQWYSKGMALKRYMNMDDKRWWIINQAHEYLDLMKGFFLKVTRENGEEWVYTYRNGCLIRGRADKWGESW